MTRFGVYLFLSRKTERGLSGKPPKYAPGSMVCTLCVVRVYTGLFMKSYVLYRVPWFVIAAKLCRHCPDSRRRRGRPQRTHPACQTPTTPPWSRRRPGRPSSEDDLITSVAYYRPRCWEPGMLMLQEMRAELTTVRWRPEVCGLRVDSRRR